MTLGYNGLNKHISSEIIHYENTRPCKTLKWTSSGWGPAARVDYSSFIFDTLFFTEKHLAVFYVDAVMGNVFRN